MEGNGLSFFNTFTLVKRTRIAFLLYAHFLHSLKVFELKFQGYWLRFSINTCSIVRETNAAYTKHIQSIFIRRIYSKNLKLSVEAEIW